MADYGSVCRPYVYAPVQHDEIVELLMSHANRGVSGYRGLRYADITKSKRALRRNR